MERYAYKPATARLSLQNGHKHWISGWFGDRAVQVDPVVEGTIHKRLVSFVHYGDEAMFHDDVVLIQVGNLYIQYNRAKDYNIDAQMPNTVTITEATSIDDVSDGLAALSAGENYTYANFNNSGNSLIVEVCKLLTFTSELDYGIVSIYLDNGEEQSACNIDYTPQPTPPPVALTISPTSTPTLHPSGVPTRASTSAPTISMDNTSAPTIDEAQNSIAFARGTNDGSVAADNTTIEAVKTGAMATGSALAVLFVLAVLMYHCLRYCRDEPVVINQRRRKNNFVLPTRKVTHDVSETRHEEEESSWSSTNNDDDGCAITEAQSTGFEAAKPSEQ
jgi:hypothetical protein